MKTYYLGAITIPLASFVTLGWPYLLWRRSRWPPSNGNGGGDDSGGDDGNGDDGNGDDGNDGNSGISYVGTFLAPT